MTPGLLKGKIRVKLKKYKKVQLYRNAVKLLKYIYIYIYIQLYNNEKSADIPMYLETTSLMWLSSSILENMSIFSMATASFLLSSNVRVIFPKLLKSVPLLTIYFPFTCDNTQTDAQH